MIISIAIPAYKAKYLAQAIESVLNQTWQEFELLILDGKSVDGTIEKVQKLVDEKKANCEVRIISEKRWKTSTKAIK